jgi:MraZ protein
MIFFNGAHEHTIDAKNRLAIPSEFRERIDPDRDGKKYYIVPGTPRNRLWIFTQSYFESVASRLGSDLIRNSDLLAYEQKTFPRVADAEPDSQGRIIIPEWMLRKTGLGREVMVCGVRDHMEVRRRDEWEKELEEEWGVDPELALRARQVLEEGQRQQ